jgi:hypothetical protein
MRLMTTRIQVQLSGPSLMTGTAMISVEDLIGFCDLTPDEVEVVAEHEHVSQAAAAVLGNYLLESEPGCEKIRDMLMDEIRTAVQQHDATHARQFVSMLRHFLHEHPNAAFRHAG